MLITIEKNELLLEKRKKKTVRLGVGKKLKDEGTRQELYLKIISLRIKLVFTNIFY